MKRRPKTVTMLFALFMAIFLSAPNCSFSQCVFPEDVHRGYKKVNKTDGVTENEAILIAQNEFIKRDVKNYFLKVLNKIKSKDGAWVVTFQAYADGPESGQALDVCVDKKTGEIMGWNKRPLIIKEGKIKSFGPIVTQRIEAE